MGNLTKFLKSIPLKPCSHCGGSGRCLDDKAIGMALREKREGQEISGREIARRLGYSAAYLSDMELGRRCWNGEKVKRYLTVLSNGTPSR